MNLEQDMEYSRCQISCIELPKYPTYAMFIICNSATCIDLMDSILDALFVPLTPKQRLSFPKNTNKGLPVSEIWQSNSER